MDPGVLGGAGVNALRQIPLPFDVKRLPQGFFGAECCNLLYQLAARAGSVLEIGSWVGRSTTVIAYAIQGRQVPFVTMDYFVQTDEEWRERFRQNLSDKRNAHRYRKFMDQDGGSLAALKQHLTERGVRSLVEIIHGDVVAHDFGSRQFDLIFCDATHWEWEIDRTVPRCLQLLRPGGVLACHDITTPALEAAVLKHGQWDWHHVDHKLFYGQVAA